MAALRPLVAAAALAAARGTIHLPPTTDFHSVPVNFSLIVTDISSFDEKLGEIIVNADMTISWREHRWLDAFETFFMTARYEESNRYSGPYRLFCYVELGENCTEAFRRRGLRVMQEYIGARLFGASEQYLQAAQSLWDKFTGQNLGVDPWTPIPKQLLPKTSNNPLSLTKVNPVLYTGILVNIPDPALQRATWLDTDTTRFQVSLDYTDFPFDHQVLELCVPFDMFAKVTMLSSEEAFEEDFGGMPLSMSSRTQLPFTASSVSRYISQRAIDSLGQQGWHADSVAIRQGARGLTRKTCLDVEVRRKTDIIILRLFGPMIFLVCIPFAGFWLPVKYVMPRVATGFISFLSLQVFRGLAYGMVPQPSSSLVWIDVTMFCITEIMFLTVIQNVVAQKFHASVSKFASRYVDQVSQTVFPGVTAVTIGLLFVMGMSRAKPILIMLVAQGVLLTGILIMAIRIACFVRRLPEHIMRLVVLEIMDERFLWRDGITGNMDLEDMAAIFRALDTAKVGCVTGDQIADGFKRVGGEKFSGKAESNFREHMRKTLDGKAVGLDGFRRHLREFFNGEFARLMHLHSKKAGKLFHSDTRVMIAENSEKDDEEEDEEMMEEREENDRGRVPSGSSEANASTKLESGGTAPSTLRAR